MYVQEVLVEGTKHHLRAVPSSAMVDSDPRDRMVPATTSGKQVKMRFHIISSATSFRLTKPTRYPSEDWEYEPRIDALQKLAREDPGALPFRQEGTAVHAIVSDAEETQQSEDEDDEDLVSARSAHPQQSGLGASASTAPLQAAQAALLGRSGEVASVPTLGGHAGDALAQQLATMSESLAAIRRDQVRMTGRLTTLERGERIGTRPPVVDSGTFGGVLTSTADEDRALIRQMEQLRPTSIGAEPARRSGGGVTFPRRDSLESAAESAPHAPGTEGPAQQIAAAFAQAIQLVARPSAQAKASGPLGIMPEAKLFNMEGAKGRLAQDLLEQQLKDHPDQVGEDFEHAVRREAPPEDPNETDISLGQMQRAWRQTVPAKEHPLAARMAEALLHVYHHLRAGRTVQAQARLALILGALEQGVRDNGQFQKRADLIMSMPPPPLSLYHAPTAEERQQLKDEKSKGLGGLARLVGAARATTARAVYLENSGA